MIDHVLPQSLGGNDTRQNLAAACYRCNEFKGSKTHTSDPTTGLLVPLFNPRSRVESNVCTQFEICPRSVRKAMNYLAIVPLSSLHLAFRLYPR